MKVLFFLWVTVIYSLFAQEEGFLHYCENSQKGTPSDNLIKQLKFNFSTSDCQKIFSSLNKNRRVFVYCHEECDVESLTNFKEMKSLEVINAQIDNIGNITRMTSLKKLNLFKNRISDLSSILALDKLVQLNLRENRCRNIDQLSSLIKLRELDLGNNQIVDVSSLADLQDLRILDLSHNKIRDISSLVKLRKLISINLKSNPIIRSRKNCPYGRGVPLVISQFCRRYLKRG